MAKLQKKKIFEMLQDSMVVQIEEFSNREHKIRKIFA